jgi:hypothetical protein
MAKPWWFWIVVVGVPAVGLLGGMIARSRSGLGRKEMAVVRRATRRSESSFAGGGTGWLGLVVSDSVGGSGLAAACFAYYRRRAALKRVVDFNPRRQNRAEGVIFSFYELRITRTELIRGYGPGAAITNSATVTIEGPGTKFAYRRGADDPRRARQFATLLNYEANRQNALL